MYDPDQPRDEDGKWTSGAGAKAKGAAKDATHFIAAHDQEILIGSSVLALALLSQRKMVARGTMEIAGGLGKAAPGFKRALTVSKIGPTNTKPLQAFWSKSPDSVEAWKYHRGPLDPQMPKGPLFEGPVKIGRRIQDLRIGGETVKGTKVTTYGAPKPIGYGNIQYKPRGSYTMAGGSIGLGVPLIVGGAVLYEKGQ